MEPLFELEKEPNLSGAEQNLAEIEKYVGPILRNNDIGIMPVKAVPHNVLYELVANLHFLYLPHIREAAIKCQILVIHGLTEVATQCRYNIPTQIVNSTPEQKRIKVTLSILEKENVHLLLYITTGWFFFAPYASIPEEMWRLTYRHKPTRLDRMYVPASYLEGKIFPIEKLKDYALKHIWK